MKEVRWVPLLEGGAAAEARDVAHEIVAAVEKLPPTQLPGLQGDASAALLLAHCGRPVASARLEASLAAMAEQPNTLSLFSGISGTSWVLGHVAEGPEARAIVAHLDAALQRHISVPHWLGRYDLITGLVGVGVCVADRRDTRALQIADMVLSHLDAAAVVSDTGRTWHTPPQFLPAPRRLQFPAGVVDLGVAHGVPGIIGMLAQFAEGNVGGERSRCLLESAVAWLLTSVPKGQPRFGTNWPTPHHEFRRIGWCYGDVGIAGVLLRASRALGSLDLEREGLDLLEMAVAPLAKQSVPDAGFCHGAAGLAHVYNLAFQRTMCSQMRSRADHWLTEVLRFRKPGFGIAGYSSLKIGREGPRWEADATLLSGVVGIALVLLAATEDREPEWQRLFLL